MLFDRPPATIPARAAATASVPPGAATGRKTPLIARPPWRASDLVVGMGALLLAIALAVALLAALGAPRDGGEEWSVGAAIGVNAAMAGIVLGLARRRGITFSDLGFRRPTRLALVLLAWLGAYAVLALYGVLLLLPEALGLDVSALRESNPPPVGADAGLAAVLLAAFAVVAAAPLGEEIFFRGLLYRGLRSRSRLLPALALSGLLFGLFHLNLGVLAPFAGIGMLFAWAVERSGSLWTSIAAHAAFNSLAFGLHLAGAGS